jgi:transcriptional regulator with XRE-family HTH domain
MSTQTNDSGERRGAGGIPLIVPAWDITDAMNKSLKGMEHLTVQGIAHRLGVSRNTVGNWLNGRVQPDDRTLIAWAELTAVPYKWLIGVKNRSDPFRPRFTPDEIREFEAEAAERGVSLSVFLRERIQRPIPEDELESYDTDTLRQMWFENHRIHIAQKEDTAPREMADHTSLYSPVMATRLEDVLNRRHVYPALELNRVQEHVPNKEN